MRSASSSLRRQLIHDTSGIWSLTPFIARGDVVPQLGGIRKVRWRRAGSGKSGGVRVIYFTRTAEEEVVLLLIYAKSRTDNITGTKLKEIRRVIEN